MKVTIEFEGKTYSGTLIESKEIKKQFMPRKDFEEFFKECIDESDNAACMAKSFFKNELNEWLKKNNKMGMSDVSIAQEMKLRGIDSRKVSLIPNQQKRVWLCIKLNTKNPKKC